MSPNKEQLQFVKVAMLCVAFLSFGVIFAISLPAKKTAGPEASASSSPPAKASLEGQSAPDFTLQTLAGKPVKLSSLKGKVVFLNFWATWCEPCKQEMPSMERLYTRLKGQPFEMLAVSVDRGDSAVISQFLAKEKIPHSYSILRDRDDRISRGIYKITGVPETFIIDRQGKVAKHVLGAFTWDDPQIVQFFEQLLQAAPAGKV